MVELLSVITQESKSKFVPVKSYLLKGLQDLMDFYSLFKIALLKVDEKYKFEWAAKEPKVQTSWEADSDSHLLSSMNTLMSTLLSHLKSSCQFYSPKILQSFDDYLAVIDILTVTASLELSFKIFQNKVDSIKLV